MFEDIIFAYYQMQSEPILILYVISSFVSVIVLNFSICALIRDSSQLDKCLIENIRSVIIWILFLALKKEDFIWTQLVGFLLIFSTTIFLSELYDKTESKENNKETNEASTPYSQAGEKPNRKS